jgi:pimeloyl-ACP methyl ester carboxylesterase
MILQPKHEVPPTPQKAAAPKQVPAKASSLASALAGKGISDKTGLERAYSQGDAYAYGNTLYIAGSHTAKDWYDDVTKVPVWGDLRNATRYQQAEKALKANPNITNVVGHSLGGSVALELQKNHAGLSSRTYGAPVWDPLGRDRSGGAHVDRYRNFLDPVSILDRSATNSVKWNPLDSKSLTHDYSNIATNYKTGGNQSAKGWTNPDNSVSLTQ